MRNRHGYSMVELLTVTVMLALLIAITLPTFLGKMDDARGSTMLAQARMVCIAAQGILTEQTAAGTDEDVILAGLSGTYHSAAYPKQSEISAKMADILAPDVLLSVAPSEETAKVVCTAENGKLMRMEFQRVLANRLYTIVIENNESHISFERLPPAPKGQSSKP